MTVRVKICGIRDIETARAAVEAGADALGFVFAASRRQVTPEAAREIIAALPPFVTAVGVFVDLPPAVVREVSDFCRLDAVQLHGAETPEYCRELNLRVIKAVRVRDAASLEGLDAYPVQAVLLDTYVPGTPGGTGKTFNWGLLAGREFRVPLILAGGLTPENVRAAVQAVRPYAVDVSGGVETDGRKDPAKIRAFIRQAKEVV
ncbi:MAG: phosphoribosylanthranilate isomerase [Bacillota bacterium]|jgi:phosphoribosylanthranilate isomerase|nr:phosphoribosylanthranilate isomerase [Thermoanaerobacteraceae bacterium]